jgi:hypothetical protein
MYDYATPLGKVLLSAMMMPPVKSQGRSSVMSGWQPRQSTPCMVKNTGL